MKSLFTVLAVLAVFQGGFSHLWGEPAGEWHTPSADGKPLKHTGTELSFPQQIGNYRLMGQFSYDAGGGFIRYENLDQRARADIFLFRAAEPVAQLDDRHRAILKEMDSVMADLQGMANQGRYKNVQLGDIASGYIPLWQQDPLPMAIREVIATRVGNSKEGLQEAVIKQWVGVTILKGFVFTIRHLRPADTGTAGEADMKSFVGSIFQIVKDPPLRADVKRMVEAYLLDPFSPASEQAAGAVLAYLKQSPFFPIHIPEHPVAVWLERCKSVAPGTEDHLLRGFMLGSAKAAFEEKDAETCLNAGARQFARVYRHLLLQNPKIALPEIEQFVAAAEKDKAAAWLKEKGADTGIQPPSR